MSDTGHYLRLLDDTQKGLRELLRILTFVFEDPKDKFMKREFIREMDADIWRDSGRITIQNAGH